MPNNPQWIVLGFGIVVALAGLIAFFVRKDEGSNRIKLFGGEFELSTPALVIFLAGSAVAVASLYLPMAQPAAEERGGTESALTNNKTAHDMRFLSKPTKLSLEQCLDEGKKALKRGEFSVSKVEGGFVQGFSNEYNGLIVCLTSPSLTFFVVSGPDWEIAQKKLSKMEIEFSIE